MSISGEQILGKVVDEPVEGIVDLISGITFGLDLDHISVETAEAAKKLLVDFDKQRIERGIANASYMQQFIDITLDIHHRYIARCEELRREFREPADWLQYRRLVSYLLPAPSPELAYGREARYSKFHEVYAVDKKKSRPIAALVIGQSPVVVDGVVACYSTLAFVEGRSSFAAIVDEQGVPTSYPDYYRLGNKKYQRLDNLQTEGRIVNFMTPERIRHELVIPDKKEVEESYDSAAKKLIYSPDISMKYAPIIPVDDIRVIDGITDQGILDFEVMDGLMAIAATAPSYKAEAVDKLLDKWQNR